MASAGSSSSPVDSATLPGGQHLLHTVQDLQWQIQQTQSFESTLKTRTTQICIDVSQPAGYGYMNCHGCRWHVRMLKLCYKSAGMGVRCLARRSAHRWQGNTGPPCCPHCSPAAHPLAPAQQNSAAEQPAGQRLLAHSCQMGQHQLAPLEWRPQVLLPFIVMYLLPPMMSEP